MNLLLNLCYKQNESIQYFLNLLYIISNTFGTSLIVAAIFNFTIDSHGFVKYINDILTKIVVSKEFLNRLDINEKKSALKLILKPSEKQLNFYANINDYFNNYIDNSMNIFNTNFKSNLILNLDCTYESDGSVFINETLSYRVHKTYGSYEPLKVAFEREDSILYSTEITAPNGSRFTFKDTKPEKIKSLGGIQVSEYTTEIPEPVKECKYLSIYRKLREFGNDHWQMFIYRAKESC